MKESSKEQETENNYEKYLQRVDRAPIIIQIKSDLLDKYSSISILELEILSDNVYDFCCLMANNVPETEVSSYIVHKSKSYYDKLSNTNFSELTTLNHDKLSELTQKYIKLIKSNLGG